MTVPHTVEIAATNYSSSEASSATSETAAAILQALPDFGASATCRYRFPPPWDRRSSCRMGCRRHRGRQSCAVRLHRFGVRKSTSKRQLPCRPSGCAPRPTYASRTLRNACGTWAGQRRYPTLRTDIVPIVSRTIRSKTSLDRLPDPLGHFLFDRSSHDRDDAEVAVALGADRAAVSFHKQRAARPLPRVVERETTQLLERLELMQEVNLCGSGSIRLPVPADRKEPDCQRTASSPQLPLISSATRFGQLATIARTRGRVKKLLSAPV